MKKYMRNTLFMVFLTLQMTLFMAACANGPKITDCTPRIPTKDFKCFNRANNKASIVAASKLESWICTDAADELSIQKACDSSNNWPKINVCSFDPIQMHYICFSEVTNITSTVLFLDSNGFICVSPVDEQILLEYCEERAQAANGK